MTRRKAKPLLKTLRRQKKQKGKGMKDTMKQYIKQHSSCDVNNLTDDDKMFLSTNYNKSKQLHDLCCSFPKNFLFPENCKVLKSFKNEASKNTAECNIFNQSDEYKFELVNNPKEAKRQYDSCCYGNKTTTEQCKGLEEIVEASKAKYDIKEKKNFETFELPKLKQLQQEQEQEQEQKQQEDENDMNFSIRSPGVRIGSVSVNGIILEVPFLDKSQFQGSAVMKMSASSSSDNLVYEYFAGKYFINTFARKYPCFMRTYSLYQISQKTYDEIKKAVAQKKLLHLNKSMFTLKNFSNLHEMFEETCQNPQLYCPLVQFIPGLKNLGDALEQFVTYVRDIPGILFQVFFALDQMKDIFTHSDLHQNNITFYEPFKDKYFYMNYHLEDGTKVYFPTRYISKIIDYGRVIFKPKNPKFPGTEKMINALCKTNFCKSQCEEDGSLQALRIFVNNNKATSVNKSEINQSIDIWSLSAYKEYFKKFLIFNDVVQNKDYYLTVENKALYNKNDKIIYNVSNAKQAFQDILPNWSKMYFTEDYIKKNNLTLAGEIHVYTDGKPFEFVPA
jgi:hypothetical protein